MRFRPLLPILLLSIGLTQAQTQPGLDDVVLREEPLPPGSQLMREVRAQLPPQELDLYGFIQTRDQSTRKTSRLLLRGALRFGAETPHVMYVLMDENGTPQETLRIEWRDSGIAYGRLDASGKEATPPASLEEKIANTGITWSDLSLAFLWWPDAKTVERDRVKTRSSFVVEFPVPGQPDQTLRVWIDAKARFVVKAELRDTQGKKLKKIEVDSIKEIREDLWMVKDLEIRDYADKQKILVRIETVEERGARLKPLPANDSGEPARPAPSDTP